MSTQATQRTPHLESQQPPEEGWIRLESPELVEFEKPGATVFGRLISVTEVEVRGKKVPQYVLTVEQKRFKFLGTYDLVQKLNASHRGMLVRVKFLGTDPSISRNGNAMKVFDVMVKPDQATAVQPQAAQVKRLEDGTYITDEDIPF